MRGAVENWLLRTWYGGQQPPWFLRMLEPVYRFSFRHLQERGHSSPDRYRSHSPLVVVGNLTVGGSGKTPLVIHLCKLAMELNIRPGIASTGYSRPGTETIEVTSESDARTCGDEPVMLAIRTGVPVVVAKNRIDAVKTLDGMGLDLIFSDDGLQKADMERDIEICVIDGARGFGNGHLLPAGPLREPASRLNSIDHVVTTGVWVNGEFGGDVIVMQLDACRLVPLDGSTALPVEEFLQKHKGIELHAIAGIGNPQRFFGTLKDLGIKATPRHFPDHHLFSRSDFDFMAPGSVVIMTEKDAVKCRDFGLENAWCLPLETRLPVEFESMFKNRLAKLMEERT